MPATTKYFFKAYSGKYGLRGDCKECRKEYRKQHYKKNKEQIIEKRRLYYKENKNQISEQKKFYYEKNKEQIIKQKKQYYRKNKKQILEYRKQYIIKRLKTDVGFRILFNCRRKINHAIKGNTKSASTKKLIGCSIEKLLEHLESQFQEGMTWNNYGEWHVDHIKPCALFDFTKEEDQRECFHYTNLQPLWAEDNLRKGSNYDEELMFESRRGE